MGEWEEEIRRRLAGLKLEPAREEEIVEELSQHLDDRYRELLSIGATEAEARRAAITELSDSHLFAREIGRVEMRVTRERVVLGARRKNLMGDFWQDFRFGVRMLGKNPGFTVVAVLTLALGIGANTAIFSVVHALLLRPLPYRQPEQLVKVFRVQPDSAKGMLPSIWSYPCFEMLREQNQSFAEVVGFNQSPYNLTGTDAPERLQMEMVSDGYFPLLGVNTIVGRSFTAEDAGTVAMLSSGLWQRRFGGDVQVIGKTIELDKQAFTIVGVLPPGFRGQSGTADVWLPMNAAPKFVPTILTDPNDHWFQVIARLKDGVTLAQAQADMQQVSAQTEQKYPSLKEDTLAGNAKVPVLAPLQAAKVEPMLKTSFLLLLAAVGLVLLIACANVANLLLARAVARQREFALRSALGASRWRLLRQLITESLLLALTGGALGVLVAHWGVSLLMNIRPSDNTQFSTSYARAFEFFTINLDWRVLSFNFALALLTGLLFGLVPALQSSFINVNEALKEGAGGSGAGFQGQRKSRVRSLLLVGEIAFSLVLLSGAGLMINSLLRLQSVNLGFVPENLLAMTVHSRDAKPEFYERLLARVQALPGVEAASLSRDAPLLGRFGAVIDIEGRADIKKASVGFHSVSPDYFKTLGINLLRGRVFTEQDRAGATRVALINQAAAEFFFPGEDPIGKRLRPYVTTKYQTNEKFVEIVGVVADVRYGRLEEAIGPDIYVSALQPTDRTQMLVVRSSVEAAALTAAVQQALLAMDRNIPLTAIQTMQERAAEVTSRTRFIAVVLGLFAGLALLLAGLGIYGVMAYSVSARTREVGIRMALGAQATDVIRLVLNQGMSLAGIGVGVGLLASLALTRLIEGLLFGVSANDPLTFSAITLLLLSVAGLACWLPARRAAKVDPLVALRCE